MDAIYGKKRFVWRENALVKKTRRCAERGLALQVSCSIHEGLKHILKRQQAATQRVH